MKLKFQTFRQLYYCGITKAKSRNSEKETTWKFLLRVDKIRRKRRLKTKNMELIFQVKWKQLKQVEASKHLTVYYMKPLNSPTPLNTSWIETSFQTAAWNLRSKHRVVVVPQLNINSTAIVKRPTSMNLLYVKCWIESNVVRNLTQHTFYRSKLQNMSFSDATDASVLVLQLRGFGNGLLRGIGSGANDMWLVLVDDEKWAERVVGREHKRAHYPKKDSPSLYCMIGSFLSCHQLKYLFFRYWIFFNLDVRRLLILAEWERTSDTSALSSVSSDQTFQLFD